MTPDGLALDVMIGLNGQSIANLVAAGQLPPSPLLLHALIATGSDATCVASRVLVHFGLGSVFATTTQTISGSLPVNLYEVSLTIPRSGALTGPLLVEDQLLVMELVQPPANFEVILGLDVIRQLLLISDGPRSEFTLSA
jgi:hypothetical protein